MKPPLATFSDRGFLDTVGLLAILGLLTLNAFHYHICEIFPYYRELIGALFAVLCVRYLLSKALKKQGGDTQRSRPLFYLLLFPALLFLWSFIDPGVPLYGDQMLEMVSKQLSGRSTRLYVLRNALLYLPMVLYVYFRGVSLAEIRLIALTAVLIAPLGIAGYLQYGETATLAQLGLVAELGGRGLAYNSYVPYLTFLVLCGIYLIFSPSRIHVKWMASASVGIVSIYCLLSTSRQSVLFIVICFAVFFYFSQEGKTQVRKLMNMGLALMVFMAMFFYFTRGYEFSETFLDRYSSVKGFTETARAEIMIEGLKMLEPMEWLTGAGLTSVLVSGPHNDYIRWTQRVGAPLMFFGFLPFFIIFMQIAKLALRNRRSNTLFLFLALAVGFTLFHSMFCYPREEANQAVAVFLGIALAFGVSQNELLTDYKISERLNI